MAEPTYNASPFVGRVKDRLDSWKEIARYLNRDVTTVQRWEKREGMPVHRHLHDSKGSVYASRAELDAWAGGRNLQAARQNGDDVTLDDIPIPPPPSPSPLPHSGKAKASNVQVGPSPGSKIRIPKLRWLLLAACLASIFFVSVWIRHQRQPADPPIRSLAILPLDDMSPGTREEYFADGMTDELITELARIPGLRVVSRTSVMQDKGKRKPLAQIARELNVDAVVEGSVVRAGDRVRITAQLIDTRSDRHLWAQTFEGPLGDVLSLQDNVAREIASQTRAVLTPVARAELTNAKHINPEAHDAYLRGLYFIQRRDGVMAASNFRAAIALEPEYAEAHAGLAEALVTQFIVDQVRGADAMPSAVAAARRAVQLDPNSGEAYTALGAVDLVFLHDWNAAEQNLRKGIALSPSNSNAENWYAIYLIWVNRPAEAVDAARDAIALDPLSFWANRNLGLTLFYARRYDESLAALKRASEIAPDKSAGFVEKWNSAVYEVEGRYADAVTADLKGFTDLSPAEVDSLRSVFETGGWKAYQETLVKILLPRYTKTTPCDSWGLPMSYLRLGNLTEAFRWFNRQADEHCAIPIRDSRSALRPDSFRSPLHRFAEPNESFALGLTCDPRLTHCSIFRFRTTRTRDGPHGRIKAMSAEALIPAAAFVNAYLGLGDKEQTFAWMERAHQEQSMILQFLKVHPYFEPVRDDPRFADLLRRVGLS